MRDKADILYLLSCLGFILATLLVLFQLSDYSHMAFVGTTAFALVALLAQS